MTTSDLFGHPFDFPDGDQDPHELEPSDVHPVTKKNPGYPTNWPDIARQIKDRAGWKCEDCAHPHDTPTGHVLTVHHLDGDPSNCDPDNIRALCQRCHLKRQGRLRLYGPEDERQMRLC